MNKFIITIVLLLGNTTVNADWLLNGETESPPIEDIKGEIGSDMKFGFVKGIFSLPAKIVGDDKVNDRIKATEEGRNTKAVTTGEIGAAIAISTTIGVAGGVLTTGKLTAQVANLSTKVEKTDKYLEYQNNAIKAQDNAIKAQDNAIKALERTQKYQSEAIKALNGNLDTIAEKLWTNPQ